MQRKPLTVKIGFAYAGLGDGQQRLLYLPQAFSCAWCQPSGIQLIGCGKLKKRQDEGNEEQCPHPLR